MTNSVGSTVAAAVLADFGCKALSTRMRAPAAQSCRMVVKGGVV